MDNELLLFDRINVIKDTIKKYGEDNFYLSFSGGKDSTLLHYLLDLAIPNNKIPRVYMNTGIEYLSVVNFVKQLADNDPRIVIIASAKPIKQTLDKVGYPFKSKDFSKLVEMYHNQTAKGYLTDSVRIRVNGELNYNAVPKCLKYLFDDEVPKIKISNRCCYELKKKVAHKWEKVNNRSIAITGMRSDEGGQRANYHNCILLDKKGNLKKFHPLIKVNEEWENWFVEKQKIKLCELYYPPFNFKRTGCKGCPFALDLQEQLSIMEVYLPNERKQCEIIWKPVYNEYRILGYRLDKAEQLLIL